MANRLLVIRCLANGLEHSRFAFVVSKRLGNAVTRNRIKRRLREAVRETRLRGGWDAVFIARRGAQDASYHQLSRAAHNLLRRSKVADVVARETETSVNSSVASPGGEMSQ